MRQSKISVSLGSRCIWRIYLSVNVMSMFDSERQHPLCTCTDEQKVYHVHVHERRLYSLLTKNEIRNVCINTNFIL